MVLLKVYVENWGERDSNPRRQSSTDLQSVAFNHSAISPFSWQWDLNPQPADYKSAALPIELCQQQKFFPYTEKFVFCQSFLVLIRSK